MAEYIKEHDFPTLPKDADEWTRKTIEKILNGNGKERVSRIRKELQEVMMDKVSVFRTGESIKEAIEKIKELKERYKEIKIDDKGKRFNTDLIEAIELGKLA
jgi:succinate dehydrogenase / fumarate reductase flavoprotein subunit